MSEPGPELVEVVWRCVKRLVNRPEAERTQIVSDGLKAIRRYVDLMCREASAIHDEGPLSSEIVMSFADELAGRAMLLLDFIRPPQGTPQQFRANHLKGYYDHTITAAYERYYNVRCGTFEDACEYLRNRLFPVYVDGDDVLYRSEGNELELGRGWLLYPDLYEERGAARWYTPIVRAFVPPLAPMPPQCLSLVQAMNDCGLLEVGPLEVLKRVWGSVELLPSTTWDECRAQNIRFVETCHTEGTLIQHDSLSTVVEELRYPLCGVDWSRLMRGA